MKKFLALLFACFLLTACGEAQPPVAEQPEPPVVEAPVQPEVVPEPEAVCTMETLEGLVEDTVGYVYQYPVFTNETINEYYTELMANLETYAKETIYPAAMEKHTIANIEGFYEVVPVDDEVTVTYVVTVEFGDGETEEFERVDTFILSTGQKKEA